MICLPIQNGWKKKLSQRWEVFKSLLATSVKNHTCSICNDLNIHDHSYTCTCMLIIRMIHVCIVLPLMLIMRWDDMYRDPYIHVLVLIIRWDDMYRDPYIHVLVLIIRRDDRYRDPQIRYMHLINCKEARCMYRILYSMNLISNHSPQNPQEVCRYRRYKRWPA